MGYEQNIQRLSSTSRFNTSQAQANETQSANQYSDLRRREAEKQIQALSSFSKTIKDEHEKRVERLKSEGRDLQIEQRGVDAKRLLEVEQLLLSEKKDDIRYHELKAEKLKLEGINAYPEADRIAKLSHYQQIGYMQERLRNAMTSYPDTLNYRMQNGETPYQLNGITYTAKQLRANNINSLPLKTALVEVEAAKLRKEMGLDEFSPELLEAVGVNKTINAAKDAYLGKVRKRYTIDSSAKTQAQSALSWKNSPKTGDDIHHFLVTTASTVDKNGELFGNEGSWNAFMAIAGKEGISMGDPGYADTIGNLPIPLELAKKVGAKPGTTFSQHWPTRFSNLKSAIKKGYVEATNAELKFQKAAGVELEAEFIKANKERPLSNKEINEWKRKFTDIGLPIPAGINKYETASDRNQAEDEDRIDALMASQQGRITREQAEGLNPAAVHAKGLWDKIEKWEKSALKDHDAVEKIKGHLNTTFTDMGIKANEKSPAYIEALSNAKADYAKQYNRYIAMNYSSADASYLALRGKPGEAKDEKGQPILGVMGVLTEIEQNGNRSKYVVAGQSVEKTLKPGHIRVAQIQMAKQEILNDKNVVTTKVIGGDYGHRQITAIKNNLDSYGPQGLFMDPGALQYYKGISRGRNPREGGFWGLVDAQLKAIGHEGLNPASRPAILSLTTGKDANGKLIPDKRGHSVVNRRVAAATRYPSINNNLYVLNMLQDEVNYGQTPISVWDQKENLNPWLVGGTA